jgi:cbb3-type cytochrome oxidase cytochrome c subunit
MCKKKNTKTKKTENNKYQIITLSGRALGILHACKQCSSSSWVRGPLARERERERERDVDVEG